MAGVATGADFPDALTGSAAMGAFSGPILLSNPDGVPGDVSRYTAERSFPIGDALLFGGTLVLQDEVADEVKALISTP